ncbi:MAG TPA: hypothetical protein VIC85_16740 [Ktedonobacterales bacterium]|jgi:hypothetical protein
MRRPPHAGRAPALAWVAGLGVLAFVPLIVVVIGSTLLGGWLPTRWVRG